MRAGPFLVLLVAACSAGTAPRLARVVGSLAKKEPDPARHARIEALAARLQPGFD